MKPPLFCLSARCGAVVLAVLLSGPLAPPAQAKQKCTDFSAYAEGDVLPAKHKQDKYVFRFGGDASIFFGGAQFWSSGASIATPQPGDRVDIDLTPAAGGAVELTAYNALGGVEDSATVPISGAWTSVRLTQSLSPIVKLGLTGGGNESVINRVCTRY